MHASILSEYFLIFQAGVPMKFRSRVMQFLLSICMFHASKIKSTATPLYQRHYGSKLVRAEHPKHSIWLT